VHPAPDSIDGGVRLMRGLLLRGQLLRGLFLRWSSVLGILFVHVLQHDIITRLLWCKWRFKVAPVLLGIEAFPCQAQGRPVVRFSSRAPNRFPLKEAACRRTAGAGRWHACGHLWLITMRNGVGWLLVCAAHSERGVSLWASLPFFKPV
jgi:hypothetical protein